MTKYNNGCWSEYSIGDVNFIYQIDNSIDFKQKAGFIANPMTAIGILDLLKSGGYQSVVNTAEASALGKMLKRLC